MVWSVFGRWRCAAAQFQNEYIMWLVEMASSESNTIGRGGLSGRPFGRKQFVFFVGLSITALDPQIQIA